MKEAIEREQSGEASVDTSAVRNEDTGRFGQDRRSRHPLHVFQTILLLGVPMNFFTRLLLSAFMTGFATTPIAFAAPARAITTKEARKIIAPFYDMLNSPKTKDLEKLAKSVLSPDWKNYTSDTEIESMKEFLDGVNGIGKIVPDFTWDIKEVIPAGDRIIVRGQASGTPATEFFGVPSTGKKFSIMTIDIHTIKKGKVIASYNVGNWSHIRKQLSDK